MGCCEVIGPIRSEEIKDLNPPHFGGKTTRLMMHLAIERASIPSGISAGYAFRIKAETHLAMPGVTDRHTYSQLAAPRFRARRIIHPGAQHAEFELADTAFHSQQQPVVRATGIVNAVEVDDAGAHKTTELQQMMPFASVASEPRSVETQHGAHLARAKPRHKPIEPRPRHRPDCRAAKIIVDDLDVAKPATASFVDQIILSSLAFEIGLGLRLRRLP